MRHDSTITDDVTSTAKQIVDDAHGALRSKAEDHVDTLRDGAAEQIENAADAAQAAGAQFDIDSLQARAAQQVADQIEGVAQHLRGTDLNKVIHDTSEFARRNPLLFIGGAAILGLAATRFLKARDPKRVDYGRDGSDPWANGSANDDAGRS